MNKNEERALKWLRGVLKGAQGRGGACNFDRFRSDWECEIDGVRIVLEVEHSQHHPSTNVLKYWPRLRADRRLNVLLVHWYTHDGRSMSSPRKPLAKWLTDQMLLDADIVGRFAYVVAEEKRGIPAAIDRLKMEHTRLRNATTMSD